MSKSVIVKLIGDVNDTNTSFATPSTFIAGSFRLVLNGQLYEPDDERKGWVEVDASTITTNFVPRTGDELQGFYVDSVGGTTDGIVGSPFDPNNIYP